MSSVHSEPNQKVDKFATLTLASPSAFLSFLSECGDMSCDLQFLSVEGPVRRRCRTTSLSGPHVPPRGFLLVPSRVDFGLLPHGGSASVTVRMKNVGVDSCR